MGTFGSPCVSLPAEAGGAGPLRGGQWLHLDYSPPVEEGPPGANPARAWGAFSEREIEPEAGQALGDEWNDGTIAGFSLVPFGPMIGSRLQKMSLVLSPVGTYLTVTRPAPRSSRILYILRSICLECLEEEYRWQRS